MANLWGVLFAFLLFGHGVASVAIYAAPPSEKSPFNPGRSWLLTRWNTPPESQRRVARALGAVAALVLIASAGGVIGIPGLVAIWPWLVVLGSITSLATLAVFFDYRLIAGVGIDVALLAAILVFAWPPNALLGI